MNSSPAPVIRRIAARDAPVVWRHMSDPAVFGGLLQTPFTSEEVWTKRIVDGLAAMTSDVLLVAEVDGEVVGSGGLNSMGHHARRRHVMGLGLWVTPAAQGQGVGSALMSALCGYADQWAGVLRIELQVYVDNERAIGLYRKFGFEVEGRMRAHALRNGEYVDSLAMARLHPNPPTLPPR